MNKYLEIKKAFESNKNKENAVSMSKYMRNMFDFYGIPTPKRREIAIDISMPPEKSAYCSIANISAPNNRKLPGCSAELLLRI